MQKFDHLIYSSIRTFQCINSIHIKTIKRFLSTQSVNQCQIQSEVPKDTSPILNQHKSILQRLNEEITLDKTEKLYTKNASLTKRLCSALIDNGVAFIIASSVNIFAIPLFGITGMDFGNMSMYLVAPLFGFADCLSSSSRSLGKKLMHLKVIDSNSHLASKSTTFSRALWYVPLITVPNQNIVVLFGMAAYNCVNYYCLLRYKRDITEYLTRVRTVEEGDNYKEEYKEYKERTKNHTNKNSNQSAANLIFLLGYIGFILFKNVKLFDQNDVNKNVEELLETAENVTKQKLLDGEKNRIYYAKIRNPNTKQEQKNSNQDIKK